MRKKTLEGFPCRTALPFSLQDPPPRIEGRFSLSGGRIRRASKQIGYQVRTMRIISSMQFFIVSGATSHATAIKFRTTYSQKTIMYDAFFHL